MATSKWGQVVDALVALMAAQDGYRDAGTRGTDIPVFDGLEVGLSDQTAASWLAIGWTDPEQDESEPGSVEQEYLAMGGPMQEAGRVTCRVQSYRGDSAVSTARSAASAVLDDVIELLRADKTLGGVVKKSYVSGYQPSQDIGNGVWFWWTFTVDYWSDI